MRFTLSWQKFLNKISKKKLVIAAFIFITLTFWAIRLWRFEELMTFYSDQALFMNETFQMVQSQKIRLVGPMVISRIIEGRGFFTGPTLYYLLAPIAILTKWDVVAMTKIFLGIWWLTGVCLFFWIGKSRGWLAGVSTYAIYTVFPYLLNYNRLLWNPSFLPILGIFFFWLMGLIWQRSTFWRWLILGIVVGLGISFHYGAVIWILFFVGFLFYGILKKRWAGFLECVLFIFGVFIGDLPFFVFELRHHFYNLSTVMFLLSVRKTEAISGEGLDFFRHYLFPLIPLVFLGWGAIISFLSRKNILTAITLSIVVFIACLVSIDWQKEQGIGMPKSWNIKKQQFIASEVCNDVGGEPFEIASTINGDTRATDLRWWLKWEGCQPLGVEEYNQAVVLYLVAPESRPPEKETVWEIQSLRPFKIEKEVDLGNGYIFYKLRRLPKEE